LVTGSRSGGLDAGDVRETVEVPIERDELTTELALDQHGVEGIREGQAPVLDEALERRRVEPPRWKGESREADKITDSSCDIGTIHVIELLENVDHFEDDRIGRLDSDFPTVDRLDERAGPR